MQLETPVLNKYGHAKVSLSSLPPFLSFSHFQPTNLLFGTYLHETSLGFITHSQENGKLLFKKRFNLDRKIFQACYILIFFFFDMLIYFNLIGLIIFLVGFSSKSSLVCYILMHVPKQKAEGRRQKQSTGEVKAEKGKKRESWLCYQVSLIVLTYFTSCFRIGSVILVCGCLFLLPRAIFKKEKIKPVHIHRNTPRLSIFFA